MTIFWFVVGQVGAPGIGWCSRNLELSQKLSSLRGGDLNSAELKQIVMHTPWGGSRTLPQGCSTIWFLLLYFCIPSLPWLITLWIWPVELREGQQSWMKAIFYQQETSDTERICVLEPQVDCTLSIQGVGWWWLWLFPAKIGHSPAPVGKLDTELEIFLSPKPWIWVLYN